MRQQRGDLHLQHCILCIYSTFYMYFYYILELRIYNTSSTLTLNHVCYPLLDTTCMCTTSDDRRHRRRESFEIGSITVL